jgi:AcrR family transcriptional regulator
VGDVPIGRILLAAEELFAESGFDATPTSRIAERANVPKGLVHYYFRRKSELLTALIKRLPDEQIDPARIVVPGDIAESLYRLVCELDARLARSRMLSHLLWREADTHKAVRDHCRSVTSKWYARCARSSSPPVRVGLRPPMSTAPRDCSPSP